MTKLISSLKVFSDVYVCKVVILGLKIKIYINEKKKNHEKSN